MYIYPTPFKQMVNNSSNENPTPHISSVSSVKKALDAEQTHQKKTHGALGKLSPDTHEFAALQPENLP